MGDEEDGHGLFDPEGAEVVVEAVSSELVEGAEGFVEEEEARICDEGAGEGGAHSHAAGELGGIAEDGVFEADVGEGFAGDLAAFGGGEAGELEGEGDVIEDAAPREEVSILEDEGDGGARGVLRVGGGLDGSEGGAVEAGDKAEESGFAAAGGAEEGDEGSFGDVEVDAADGGDAAWEDFVDALDADADARGAGLGGLLHGVCGGVCGPMIRSGRCIRVGAASPRAPVWDARHVACSPSPVDPEA